MWWLTVKLERVHQPHPDIPLHSNCLAVPLMGHHPFHSRDPKTAGFANSWNWLALGPTEFNQKSHPQGLRIKTSSAVTRSEISFIVRREAVKNKKKCSSFSEKLRQNSPRKWQMPTVEDDKTTRVLLEICWFLIPTGVHRERDSPGHQNIILLLARPVVYPHSNWPHILYDGWQTNGQTTVSSLARWCLVYLRCNKQPQTSKSLFLSPMHTECRQQYI